MFMFGNCKTRDFIRKAMRLGQASLLALVLSLAWGGVGGVWAVTDTNVQDLTARPQLEFAPRNDAGDAGVTLARDQTQEQRPAGPLDRLDLSGFAESADRALSGFMDALRNGADIALIWWNGDSDSYDWLDEMGDWFDETSVIEEPLPPLSTLRVLSSSDGSGVVEQAPAASRGEVERIPLQALWAEAQGDDRIFHWTARNGAVFRAKVDGEAYERYATEQQRRIDVVRALLAKETDTWVQDRLRPVLAGVEERVGDYGDWMYNWWTHWILLGQAFNWSLQGVLNGEVLEMPNVVHARLNAEIRGQYDDMVLRLEVLEPQMQALVDRAVAGVQLKVLQACGPMNDARQNFARDNAREIERKDPEAGWVAWANEDGMVITLAPTCGVSGSDDEAALTALLLEDRPMSNLDASVDEVIVRLSRPFATKLISFMVLPVITTVVAGGIAIPFVGVPAGALAGLLAGGTVNALVIGFSASAAVDWLLTRTDEALSRQVFEVELRGAVRQAADSFEALVVRTMEQYVERENHQLAVNAFGHKP